jgi:prophage maintenance system killer protein
MQSAAMMGHGVAQRQAFEDGNKRTAYWLMHGFLNQHGMGHVMPDDDVDTAQTIVGWGEGTHTPEDLVNLWRSRQQ